MALFRITLALLVHDGMSRVAFDASKLVAHTRYSLSNCTGSIEFGVASESGQCYSFDAENQFEISMADTCATGSPIDLFFDGCDASIPSFSTNIGTCVDTVEALSESFDNQCLCTNNSDSQNWAALVEHSGGVCGGDNEQVKYIVHLPYCGEDGTKIEALYGNNCTEQIFKISKYAPSSGCSGIFQLSRILADAHSCAFDFQNKVWYSFGCPCADLSMERATIKIDGHNQNQCSGVPTFRVQARMGDCVNFLIEGAELSLKIHGNHHDDCTKGGGFAGTFYVGPACNSTAIATGLAGHIGECTTISEPLIGLATYIRLGCTSGAATLDAMLWLMLTASLIAHWVE